MRRGPPSWEFSHDDRRRNSSVTFDPMRTPPRSRQRYSTEAVHGSFDSGHVADRSSEAGVTPPTASRHISAVLPAPSPDRYLGRVGDTPEGCLPCAPCKRKPKQAPTYEGTTDIHQFLLQFEILSNYNLWDGETRGLELDIRNGAALIRPTTSSLPRTTRNL